VRGVGKVRRGGLTDERRPVASKPRAAMAGAAAPCEAAWESSGAAASRTSRGRR
jgi:hypothetical protein